MRLSFWRLREDLALGFHRFPLGMGLVIIGLCTVLLGFIEAAIVFFASPKTIVTYVALFFAIIVIYCGSYLCICSAYPTSTAAGHLPLVVRTSLISVSLTLLTQWGQWAYNIYYGWDPGFNFWVIMGGYSFAYLITLLLLLYGRSLAASILARVYLGKTGWENE